MHVMKGHGTENDFVLVPDLDGVLDLDEALVRALCDRYAGLGADGVLRVVRSENHPEARSLAAQAPFFMDYRNADGSFAEMCGNGARVFMRYLLEMGLVGPSAVIATRGGARRVTADQDGNVTVEMGRPQLLADRPVVTAASMPSSVGCPILMPNPHVVTWVDSEADLAKFDLRHAPHVDPPLPTGQNVEFVVRAAAHHLTLRVHERGVGETRSCGTGICAAAVAAAVDAGTGPDGVPWRVDVPGGTCWVNWRPDREVLLTGPAVLVARVDLTDQWLAAVR